MVPSPGPCSGESAEPFGYLGPHWGKLGAEASHALNNLQSKQVVPVSGIFNDLYPMAPHKRKVDRMTAEPKVSYWHSHGGCKWRRTSPACAALCLYPSLGRGQEV